MLVKDANERPACKFQISSIQRRLKNSITTPKQQTPRPVKKKGGGDYISVYIFINHLGDSRPQNKENLLVWVFLVQWVLQVGKGKEVDNSTEFNSILFTLITTKYNIFYSKKKLNVQSTLLNDFTFYGRSA